jgi:polyhydroxyalkanoate synthesis regulator phasin
MNADDVRKVLDSVFEKMTPAKAQEIAKGLLGEDRREQAQKLAGDLMETAQRNRDRVKKLVSREVASQVKSMGVATQDDVDALKRRVRDLERETGLSGAKRSTRTAKKPSTAVKKTAAAAKRSAASSSSTAPSSSAGSSSDDSTSSPSSGSSSGA